MNLQTLLEESENIHKEAENLLKSTDISEDLKKFGEVNLIGSFKYNVMLARDIDFHVIIKDFDDKIINEFFKYAVKTSLYEEIVFHDKHKFNKEAAVRYASKRALDSYYFGLKTNFNSNLWQIGVNFITQKQQSSVEIGRLFVKVTDNERRKILEFKRMLSDMGQKISSAHIYRAVLEKGISEKEDLFNYLMEIGYKLQNLSVK